MSLTLNLNLLLTVAALTIMLFALIIVVSMKKRVPGGTVGKYWNILTGLVFLFSAGYLAVPFMGTVDKEVLQMIVSFIFLFGSIYVMVTINLINKIIKVLTE